MEGSGSGSTILLVTNKSPFSRSETDLDILINGSELRGRFLYWNSGIYIKILGSAVKMFKHGQWVYCVEAEKVSITFLDGRFMP
jgi:hypothetical protein